MRDEAFLATFDAAKGLTFHDAAYLALAQRLGAGLATYDETLAAACSRLGVAVAASGR